MARKKIAFHTLGCKLNFAETDAITRLFPENEYETVDFKDIADIYVINTCSVTEQANKKCRYTINKAAQKSPDAKIVVVGCFAQLKPNEISSLPGVDLVLGTKEKFNIVNRINELEGNKNKIYSCDIEDVAEFFPSYSLDGRTRSFLKIQDGCDYKCSYCTIPIARGKSRNSSINDVLKNAIEIEKQGINEIILTGINIGDFGKTTGETFFDVIKVLESQTNINRYRISSIEPNLLTDEILEFIARSKRFVPHFHIPLQSGSDSVLKLMKRRYTTELFTQRINKIHELMPDASIGIDVIVGSPGETDIYFQECYEYLSKLDYSYLHVFTYSPRENTAAMDIEPKVTSYDKKIRSEKLHELSEQKKTLYYQRYIGKFADVLFEGKDEHEYIAGYSDNYLRVKTNFDENLKNKIVRCKITKMLSSGDLWAEITK